MKRLLLLLALVPLRLAATSPAPLPPYAAVASLVGGTWSATLPPGKDGAPRSIELTFAWAQNHQGIRFDSAFVSGDKHVPYVSGLYAFNAATKKLEMFYSDAEGSLTRGPVTLTDGVLIHDLTESDSDGTVDQVQVRIAKFGQDAFTDDIYVSRSGAFVRVASVRYERAGSGPYHP
jgi:hypothetical protein